MTYKTNRVGVRYRKVPNTYVAYMSFKKKTYYKTFSTYEEAVKQRMEWENARDRCYAREEKQKLITQKEQHLCTENCEDCIYSDILYWGNDCVLSCLYSLATGKCRPCYAGDECTVKEKALDN